jgi:hypothetical protein
MSPNTSNFSHDSQVVEALGQSGQHSGEVTQPEQTIDHAPRLNGFRTEESFHIAAPRLASASIPSESAQIARHGDSQAPDFDAASLILQGIDTVPLETLHNPAPEPAPIASPERDLEAGGEGVAASARSQSSQYISPPTKFPYCPLP